MQITLLAKSVKHTKSDYAMVRRRWKRGTEKSGTGKPRTKLLGWKRQNWKTRHHVARGGKRGTGKRRTFKVWKALQFLKAKAIYGAEIKTVYGGMDTCAHRLGRRRFGWWYWRQHKRRRRDRHHRCQWQQRSGTSGSWLSHLPHKIPDDPASFLTFTLRCVLWSVTFCIERRGHF